MKEKSRLNTPKKRPTIDHSLSHSAKLKNIKYLKTQPKGKEKNEQK